MLGSILIHELGHALAYARFGQPARVVLYHFGGLAIPESWGRRRHLPPAERFIVSAAGPLAQLLVAAAVGYVTGASLAAVWNCLTAMAESAATRRHGAPDLGHTGRPARGCCAWHGRSAG